MPHTRFFTLIFACAFALGSAATLAASCPLQWSSLGEGMEYVVMDLAVFDDGAGGGLALYAGGSFDEHISKWDGTSWSPIGGGMNGWVIALCVIDEGSGGGAALYAGGNFTLAGGVPANRIARWDGTSWSPLGSGMNGSVSALAVYDDGLGGGPALYAGGSFTQAGGVPANRIARWNGASWSALDSGVSGGSYPFVGCLGVFDDGLGSALYAGGRFTAAGGADALRIARWNGTAWSALGSGLGTESDSDYVAALTTFDDGRGAALYAAGDFFLAGGEIASGIARWDGSSWSPLGSGLSGVATCTGWDLAVFDDGVGAGLKLYAGGCIFYAGGLPASGIASWDGASWSALDDGLTGGMDNRVDALAVFDDESGSGEALYAGGDFAAAGGQPAAYIARWGCPAPTLEVDLACAPGSGVLPFSTQITCRLENPTPFRRRLAGRMDVQLAGGTTVANYRSGYANLGPGAAFVTSWQQNLPAYQPLVGDNLFRLAGQDVTPSPYNQPPYPETWDTAEASCLVTGIAP